MSIATRTGDDGTTGLMYNRRVVKHHPRIQACGAVDELNAALGMARAHCPDPWIAERLRQTQTHLVTLMGELATLNDDLPRYVRDGFSRVNDAFTAQLDECVKELESQNHSPDGWATPGANPAAAALDFARTVGRRAERDVTRLLEPGPDALQNMEIPKYLNRLSDTLWLMARRAEHVVP